MRGAALLPTEASGRRGAQPKRGSESRRLRRKIRSHHATTQAFPVSTTMFTSQSSFNQNFEAVENTEHGTQRRAGFNHLQPSRLLPPRKIVTRMFALAYRFFGLLRGRLVVSILCDVLNHSSYRCVCEACSRSTHDTFALQQSRHTSVTDASGIIRSGFSNDLLLLGMVFKVLAISRYG